MVPQHATSVGTASKLGLSTPGGAGARWMPSRDGVRWMGGGGALTPDSRRSRGTPGVCCSSSSRGRYDTCAAPLGMF